MKTAEFKNHPIHQKILELKSRCNDAKSKEKIDADLLLFIKTHCQFLSDRLGLAIHLLLNEDELNAIQNELQSALTHLSEYIVDNNAGRLQSIQQHINNSMPFVRNIPILLNKADFNFSEINANYSDYVDTKIAALNDSIHKLNQGLADSETQFNSQNEFIESLKRQLADQQNQTNEIANDFRAYLQGVQQEFEQRGILINNAQKQQFEETKNEFAMRVELLIDEITEKRDKARQMLNVIGQEGTAAHYLKTAYKHTRTANLFRWISLGLMIFIGIFILYMIFWSSQGEFNWQRYALRLLSISIFIYPATYAARESTKHRNLAHQRETAAVELVSIEPFIELLDDAKKQEIKEKLTEKYFGNGHNQPAQTENTAPESLPIDIIERIIKMTRFPS
jgi:hypothetical protein